MDNLDAGALEELLAAVGDHVAAAGESVAIVVVGGGALSVMGWVERTTNDIDVIARAREEDGRRVIGHPEPLPDVLVEAVRRVARDYGLASDWLNTAVAMQWRTGLPERFAEEIEWRRFGALDVGFAGRASIIALKLFAAVDQGSESVHFQDLIALDPTDVELDIAADWVARQDPAPAFADFVEEEVANVRDALRRDL
jgi:hypothetical protein